MLFQCLGWVLFTFLNVYVSILTHEFNREILLINLVLLLAGIFITHQYRNWILRYQWVQLPTEKLLFRVLLANTVLSLVLMTVYYLLCALLLGEGFLSFSTSQIIGNFTAVFLLLAIWNALYFSWSYIEKNRHRQIQQLRMESDLKDLEIKSIKANLQPHFMFNALNSIRALVDENPQLAREAITRMSNILRSNIAQKKELDTLQQEIALVEDYLALEKIRFEDRLHFIKEIEEDTLLKFIPTMMLQTLVENAIKHGISSLEQGGTIRVKSYIENNNLHLLVINSGLLDTKKVHEHSLSFGLNATQQRLHYFFKEKAQFKLFQQNDTVVTHIIIQQ